MSAQQINQFEGLAVAIPWGFESPFRTNSHPPPPLAAARSARETASSGDRRPPLRASVFSKVPVCVKRKIIDPREVTANRRMGSRRSRPASVFLAPFPRTHPSCGFVVLEGVYVVDGRSYFGGSTLIVAEGPTPAI